MPCNPHWPGGLSLLGVVVWAVLLLVRPLWAEEPILLNASTVTYTEPDGDQVVVWFSRPILTSATVANEVVLLEGSPGVGSNLEGLNLSNLDPISHSLDLKITVTPGPEGDGLAHVGFIDARGLDLRDVEVAGHLGAILVGDANPRTPALRSLQVASLGYAGDLADLGAEDGAVPYEQLFSLIRGGVSRLAVAGDIRRARVEVYGSPRATVGVVEIGGNLVGGTAELSGSVRAEGNIARVFVDGGLVGAAGDFSGSIVTNGRILVVSVNGSVLGGTGEFSGSIQAGGALHSAGILGSMVGGEGHGSGLLSAKQLGNILVMGSLLGGEGNYSGRIESLGHVRNLAVSQSVVGGGGEYSGSITATKTLRKGAVGMDIEGGTGDRSGAVFARRINQFLLGGSLIGGSGEAAGYVEAGQMLVRSLVGGDLVGATGIRSGNIFTKQKPRRMQIEGSSISGSGTQSGSLIVPPRLRTTTGGSSYGSYGLTLTVIGYEHLNWNSNLNSDAIFLLDPVFNPSLGGSAGGIITNSTWANLQLPLAISITLAGAASITLPEGFSIGETGRLTVGEGVVARLADGTILLPGVYTSVHFPPP